jgi:uncharacterized protein (TIGR02996 family)
VNFTEEEIDRVIAGLLGGLEVVQGGSRCHTTIRGRDGTLYLEDFDEGYTTERACTEEEVRRWIAASPGDFLNVIRAPLREALSHSLLGITTESPLDRIQALLVYGDCLDRRHLLEAVIQWPEKTPGEEAMKELATIRDGLDAYHFIRSAIGYGANSAAAGELGMRFYSILEEMMDGREAPNWRRHRATYRELTGDDQGALEDLYWEQARASEDDARYIGQHIAQIIDRKHLAEIAAAPDDDAPRLVWADVLTERGDPRGEFIVAQCTLARLAADDPARVPLEARVAELLATHAWDWSRRHGSGFERGFMSSAEVRWAAWAEEADALLAISPPLREVRFRSYPGDAEIPPSQVLEDPRLQRISALDLREAKLDEKALAALARGKWNLRLPPDLR